MSRKEILADTLARLEAERYAPLPRRPAQPGYRDPPTELTPEEQADNRRILARAIGEDLWLVDDSEVG
jgi:hypothetical protein